MERHRHRLTLVEAENMLRAARHNAIEVLCSVTAPDHRHEVESLGTRQRIEVPGVVPPDLPLAEGGDVGFGIPVHP